MKTYILGCTLFLALAVSHCSALEFVVDVFNSREQNITEQTTDIYIGDYIYCTFDGDVTGPMVYYGWVKVEPEPGAGLNRQGPNFVSFPNEVDNSNRLYIGEIFGGGSPTAYKCVASDVDPYDNRNALTGATTYFSVAPPQLAGDLFEEVDLVARAGDTIELKCTRLDDNARVYWRTGNKAGALVTMLFDSQSKELDQPGYSFANEADPNDFTLAIEVSEATAIFTRCTVVYNLLTDVESTAMIYMIEPTTGGCSADGLQNNLDVGAEVTFSGCEFNVVVSDDSALQPEEYTVMTFWNESPESDPEDYSVVDESRTLDGDAVLTVAALEQNHQMMYSCGLQIHRENLLVKPARLNDLCADDYVITVADDTARFRIYQGERADMSDDDFIDFDTLDRYKTEPTANGDLTCEVDRKPAVVDDDEIFFQYMNAGEATWTDTDSHIVPSGDIGLGMLYRCVYINAADPDDRLESGVIHMVAIVLEVEIIDSNGETLNEVDLYTFNEGDWLECKSVDPISTTYPPKFVWQRAIQVPNEDGPVQLRYDNTDAGDGSRMVLSHEFGFGELIAYRCFGTDDLGRAMIELAGTLVRFRVQAAAGSGEAAGTTFEPADYASLLDGTHSISCARNAIDGQLVWDTIDVEGTVVETLYDTAVGDPLPQGYHFVNEGDDLVFDLEVTVSKTTAILTRCTVTEEGKDTVSATAMFYLINPLDECNAIGLDPENGLGDEVRFYGCIAESITSDDSGMSIDHYDTVAYWEIGVTGGDDFTVVGETKELITDNEDSEYDLTVTGTNNGMSVRCGIQVTRPEAASPAGYLNNLCTTEYDIVITQNDIWFQLYYGVNTDSHYQVNFQDDSDEDDILSIGFVDGFQVACDAERYPALHGAVVELQEKLEDGDWQTVGEESKDGILGATYRCNYLVDNIDELSASIILVQSVGFVPELGIYLSGSDLPLPLEDDTLLMMDAGDYLVCKPLLGEVVTPGLRYVWQRSSPDNLDGPRLLHYDNEVDGSNRLPMSLELGGGHPITYRCSASMGEQLLPEHPGPAVQFEVAAESVDGGASHLQMSTSCVLLAAFTYLLQNNVFSSFI